MADADVMRMRLLARETVLSRTEASVTSCAAKLLALRKVLKTSTDAAELRAAHSDLQLELDNYDFELSRACTLQKRCERELQQFEVMHREIEEAIQATEQEIVRLREKLAEERLRRRHRMEYEELARQAAKLPARETTLRKLASLEQQLKQLGQQREALRVKSGRRKKQFQLLLASIFELQSALAEEEDDDAAAGKDEDDKKAGDAAGSAAVPMDVEEE
eukprot:PLAT2477.1.p1 GENE.PLAT2477.1~~PLAT2477.1.p1  ORF type:complete len:219 (+),score=112.90 PLAT2477.1:14-670(+)